MSMKRTSIVSQALAPIFSRAIVTFVVRVTTPVPTRNRCFVHVRVAFGVQEDLLCVLGMWIWVLIFGGNVATKLQRSAVVHMPAARWPVGPFPLQSRSTSGARTLRLRSLPLWCHNFLHGARYRRRLARLSGGGGVTRRLAVRQSVDERSDDATQRRCCKGSGRVTIKHVTEAGNRVTNQLAARTSGCGRVGEYTHRFHSAYKLFRGVRRLVVDQLNQQLDKRRS